MAGTAYQGGLVSAVKVGFNDVLNTDPDHEAWGYTFIWNHPIVDLEPEMFRSKGTETASITFKEQKTETNAEIISVYILYEIQTSA